ncbi:MAG: D-2-hydroxyacid dehydrogenase [Gemmatimonadota bacterium]
MIRSRLRLLGLACSFVVAAAVTPPAARSQNVDQDTIPLGSTRNSVVAIPAADLPDELVYLTSGMSDERVASIRSVAPNIRIIEVRGRDAALQHAGQAHGADAHLLSSAFLDAAPDFRWAQSGSAGVDRYITIPELMSRDEIVLTNMKGMYGPVIAEHVFAMMLSHTRSLPSYLDADRRGEWDRSPAGTMTALQGGTMLVVGLGGIGSEIAMRADAFNMRVLATARTERPAPPYVDVLGTGPDLVDLLPQADVVVLAVPLTDETRGMINRETIARMRDGAWLVNIARGAVVDTDALVEALDTGKVGAAFLDVTDPEPLPEGHTLWNRDNVLITPHVAARAELSLERRLALTLENMRRFGAGEPLLNVVDKAAGY